MADDRKVVKLGNFQAALEKIITQYEVLPDSPTTGMLVQYIGATQSGFTNGYFYKFNGTNWEALKVQSDTDISGKQDTFQYDTMPEPSDELAGMVVQYIGADDALYGWKQGLFYICTSNEAQQPAFIWKELDVQNLDKSVTQQDLEDYIEEAMQVEGESVADAINDIKAEIAEVQTQQDTMPADSDEGRIIQYVGATTQLGATTFNNGYFYKRVNGEWVQVDVQPESIITIDQTPTSGSPNAVTSGGVYSALGAKQNTLSPGVGIAIASDTVAVNLPNGGGWQLMHLLTSWILTTIYRPLMRPRQAARRK